MLFCTTSWEHEKLFSIPRNIIYYLHNDFSMLLLPYGEGWKDVLSWGQALTFQHYGIY